MNEVYLHSKWPVASQYERLGGEEKLRQLVARFYDYMNELPEAAPIRRMHSADLAHIRLILFEFLSGWLGGPDLYQPQYGHPRLRQRHLPFAIGDAERDVWMLCMRKALAEVVEDEGLRRELTGAFLATANHMRNS